MVPLVGVGREGMKMDQWERVMRMVGEDEGDGYDFLGHCWWVV